MHKIAKHVKKIYLDIIYLQTRITIATLISYCNTNIISLLTFVKKLNKSNRLNNFIYCV